MASIHSSSSSDRNNYALLEYGILNSLKEFIGDEPFGQYLAEYLEHTISHIDRLGHAIAAEDSERIRQISHKLKGSAGNIGALKFSSICDQLQSMAIEDEIEGDLCGHFREIQNAYEETKTALADYIKQLDMSQMKVG